MAFIATVFGVGSMVAAVVFSLWTLKQLMASH